MTYYDNENGNDSGNSRRYTNTPLPPPLLVRVNLLILGPAIDNGRRLD